VETKIFDMSKLHTATSIELSCLHNSMTGLIAQ